MTLGETDLSSLFECAPQTKLSEVDVIYIFYNMLVSLNFLHSANIIHRDIKPENILINSESQIMICDFGMSRDLPSLSTSEKKLQDFRNN